MKKKNILLIVLFGLIISFLIIYFMKKHTANKVRKEIVIEKKIKENEKILVRDTIIPDSSKETIKKQSLKEQKEEITDAQKKKKVSWKELNIIPQYTPEGVYYTFTAFEIYKGNLVTAGTYNRKNILKFYKNKNISEVEIKDTPLDLLSRKGKLYVLCLNHLYILENEKIEKEILFDIPDISLYDKLLDFDNVFTILMSDGSAYRLIDNKLIRTKHLVTKNNTEMWVKKTSPKSFDIQTNPYDSKINKSKIYDNEIGSITIIGNSSDAYYCIIDIVENTKPLIVKRIISSSKNNFKDKIDSFSNKNWSYIKNDIKLHGDTLFYIFADNSGLTLKSKTL